MNKLWTFSVVPAIELKLFVNFDYFMSLDC